ncbi:hypothetical protein CLOM621_08656 [Clostridium sp. M62/1]|nr:hypothetical protein CLOM621_08656 [Clostridium sp. M62/1]
MYFNPRSREGSDDGSTGKRDADRDFNPRSREGSDQQSISGTLIFGTISIHAPARGATVGNRTIPFFYINFNPRSREGSDTAAESSGTVQENFNPRSREGSDGKI